MVDETKPQEIQRKLKEELIEQKKQEIAARIAEESQLEAMKRAAGREPAKVKLIKEEEEAWKQVDKDIEKLTSSEGMNTTMLDPRTSILQDVAASRNFAKALSLTFSRIYSFLGESGESLGGLAADKIKTKWGTRKSQLELPDLVYTINMNEKNELNFEELKAKGALTPSALVNELFQQKVELWLKEEKGYVPDKSNAHKYVHEVTGQVLDKAAFEDMQDELHDALNDDLNFERSSSPSP